MFLFLFILLTVAYTAAGVGIIYLITHMRGIDFWAYLRDEDTWFFMLLGATGVTFIVALFHWGPAILLPENIPTPNQRGVGENILRHLWEGEAAGETVTPTTPLPWATGTWFWWKAFFLYLFLTPGFAVFAFWDETRDAFVAWRNYSKAAKAATTAGTPPPVPPTGGGHGFGAILAAELIGETIARLITHLRNK